MIRENSLLYKNIIVLSLFTAIGFLIYSNIFQNAFVFDDINNIRENMHVSMKVLSLESLKNAVSSGRPVAILTFALNHYFHGYNVWGYHFVNIAIHILNGVALFYLFSGVLSLNEKKKDISNTLSIKNKSVFISFFAALLWFVHPLQTQSVTYTVQRMNSLSALFFILSLLFYFAARKPGNLKRKIVLFALCTGTFILSICSKENGLMLPFIIILIEVCFFQSFQTNMILKYWKFIAVIAVAFLFLVFFWLGSGRINLILTGYENYDFTLLQRLLTEFRVVILYLTLIAFPWPGRLHLDYNYPLSYSIADPLTTLFSIIIVVTLIIYSVLCFKRNSRFYIKSKLLPFSIFWYFFNLLIESSFIPIELVSEHRTYLPSMFLFLAFTSLIFRRIKNHNIPVLCFTIIAILFSYWTYSRNFAWKDRITVWEDNIAKLPPKARIYSNFGTALMNESRFDESIVQFQKAIKLNPEYYPAYNNQGYSLYKLGKYQAAISCFQAAVKLKNEYPLAYQNWGDALQKLGAMDEALLKYRKSLTYKPGSVIVLNRIAMICAVKKDYAMAAEFFEKIHILQPENAAVCYNIVCMYSLMEDKEEAVRWLKKTISLGYGKWENIHNDQDLENIRSTDYYKKILEERR